MRTPAPFPPAIPFEPVAAARATSSAAHGGARGRASPGEACAPPGAMSLAARDGVTTDNWRVRLAASLEATELNLALCRPAAAATGASGADQLNLSTPPWADAAEQPGAVERLLSDAASPIERVEARVSAALSELDAARSELAAERARAVDKADADSARMRALEFRLAHAEEASTAATASGEALSSRLAEDVASMGARLERLEEGARNAQQLSGVLEDANGDRTERVRALGVLGDELEELGQRVSELDRKLEDIQAHQHDRGGRDGSASGDTGDGGNAIDGAVIGALAERVEAMELAQRELREQQLERDRRAEQARDHQVRELEELKALLSKADRAGGASPDGDAESVEARVRALEERMDQDALAHMQSRQRLEELSGAHAAEGAAGTDQDKGAAGASGDEAAALEKRLAQLESQYEEEVLARELVKQHLEEALETARESLQEAVDEAEMSARSARSARALAEAAALRAQGSSPGA